jgi:spermine synthase
MEISSIWFAGAANLYNREFYELANQRLRLQGVLQQWVQLHHMRPIDFLYILGSVRSVFNKVWIYMSGGQGIIVATNSDVNENTEEALTRLLRNKIISDIKIESLPNSLLAGPEKIDALLKCYDPALRFLVSTDKNLYLEYATPKGNAIRGDSAPVLIDMLSNFQTCPVK